MNTLKSLNLNDVDIEDIEYDIPGCNFYLDYEKLKSNNAYDMFLKIIAEKVEVVNYDEKYNTATLDLSGFVDKNFCVLDNMFDIPCNDPFDEYLNVIVAMINGYGSKPYYDVFYEAYLNDKFVSTFEEDIISEENEANI